MALSGDSSPRRRVLRELASRKRLFYGILPPWKRWFCAMLPAEIGCFTSFCFPETVVSRGFTSRGRSFYVLSPPEDVRFTCFHLPKTFVSRDFTSRRRSFYVILLPGNVGFACFHPPKTFVLRDFAPTLAVFKGVNMFCVVSIPISTGTVA